MELAIIVNRNDIDKNFPDRFDKEGKQVSIIGIYTQEDVRKISYLENIPPVYQSHRYYK